jgi:hypothetical protein
MENAWKKKEVHQYDPVTGKYIRTYPSFTVCEQELGMYRGSVSEILKGKTRMRPGMLLSTERWEIFPDLIPLEEGVIQPATNKIKTDVTGMLTEDELRRKHDMFFMVYSFVKNIPYGKFVEEPVLLRQLGLIGKPRYKDALSRAELKLFKGKVDGVVYYGNSTSIQKLKSEGVLQ